MPRGSRSSRPAPRPAAPSGTRSASTMSAPAAAAPAPHPAATGQRSSGPGMLGQMAATAGSVAAGSVVGHGISSMLFGGRGSEAQAPAPVQQQQAGPACEIQAKEFTKCLDVADFNSCSWYLEQLKACQAAAKPY